MADTHLNDTASESTLGTTDVIQVLHVDDNADLVEMAARFLEQNDDRFEITTATSATEGLELLPEHEFDCIVSDYEMPSMNGIEFLTAVRADFPDLPFILFTGKGSEEIASEAISAGVTDYLKKETGPEQYELLTNRILNAVKQIQAQRELARQQAKANRFQELLAQAMTATDTYAWEWDLQTDTIERYPTPAPVFGVDSDELGGVHDGFAQRIHPDDRAEVEAKFQAITDGDGYQVECRIQRADGSWRWVRDRAEVTHDADGTPVRAIGIVTDIHEQKRYERELERQNDLFRKAQDIADVGAWEYDPHEKTLTWTDEVYRIHDLPENFDPTVENAIEFYHPDDTDTIRTAVERAVQDGESYDIELRLETATGETRWVRTRGHPQVDDGDVDSVRGTIQDITEQKQREQQLEESRKRYQSLFENNPAVIWEEDFSAAVEYLDSVVPDGEDVESYLRANPDEIRQLMERIDIIDVNQNAVEYYDAPSKEVLLANLDRVVAEEALDKLAGLWAAIAAGETRFRTETVARTFSGETRDGLLEMYVPETHADEYDRVYIISTDITERKQRERDLKLYEGIVETMQDTAAVVDEDGQFRIVNQRLADIYGDKPQNLTGNRSRMLEALADRHDGVDPFAELVAGEREEFRTELELTFPNFGTPVVDMRMTRLTDDGGFIGVVAIGRDVSERKEREQELERARERLRSQFDNAPDGIVIHDQEGSVLDVNETMAEQLGYPRDELLNMTVPDFEVGVPEEQLYDLWTGSGPDSIIKAEGEHQRADGSTFPVEVWVDRLDRDGETRFLAHVRDITARKDRERELERQNTRLRALFEQFPEPTIAYVHEDDEPYITQVNTAFTDVFGYDADEAVGEHVDSLLVPPARQVEADAIDEDVRAGRAINDVLHRETQDGMGAFHFRNIPVPDDPEIDGYAIYADITDRREREEELEQMERIVQEMDDGVVVVQDADITYTNPQVSEIIGYEAAELLDEPMGKFIAPEDREKVRQRYRERLAGNEPPKNYEITLLTKDGDRVPVEITAAQVRYRGDPATVSIVRDISERKHRIKELRRQNERLDEFARLVSHDLRNPLNVASSRLELAQDDCESAHLANIADAHNRMETLIDNLLELARHGDEVREMDAVDVAELTERCWNTVETADGHIEIETVETVQADRNRLQRLLENLFRNAIEHGDADVRVTVGTLADADGFYVADDGPGIPEEDRDSIFESGYSSAEEGTGFGLAIVREIVNAHGWEIAVTTSDEGGARFEITGVEFVE